MALTKQNLNINFSQGLDTKTDPNQVSAGKMLALQNTIFDKGGLLQKRNGYQQLSTLPNTGSTFLTTFNGNLTAVSDQINAYSQSTSEWIDKGEIIPLDVQTLPMVRASVSDTYTDSAISSNGLVCVVYVENAIPKYTILDDTTGQTIVNPTILASSAGTPIQSPRVFVLNNYFVIVMTVTVGGTHHLQYIAISMNNPNVAGPATDISTQYAPKTGLAFDGVVANNSIYLAWNGSDIGGAIRAAYINSGFVISSPKVFTGFSADLMSIAFDATTPIPDIYIAFYNNSTQLLYTIVTDANLNTITAATSLTGGFTAANLTTYAANGAVNLFYEVVLSYGYDSSLPTDRIDTIQYTAAGSIISSGTVIRGVGLASKVFMYNSTLYFLTAYESAYQPSYFLVDQNGNVVSKLAYSNGGGYLTTGLPSVSQVNDKFYLTYLYAELVQAVNKSQGLANSAGVYSQLGINLASFNFDATMIPAEIGNNLHFTGGILWAYDGAKPVEQNYNVWPDNVEVFGSMTSGSMSAQEYFYQVLYEWTDLQGNIHRSAPSVPVGITLTSETSVTIDIPTLRLTYKTGVKIAIYRWSVAQQNYYEVTTVANPLLNDPTVDYVSYTDTSSDATILGNALIYTTGSVIEDIGPPPSSTQTLFQSRLFLVDAEDRNLIWFSKQVIEATPVEMSDLLTIYVAPTISAQGSTGPITALAAMDDKLIIFKKDAIYYLNGIGPDNTGANNGFSDPTFITATVGCTDQKSIVFMPQGLMFQSDKGIWLLGRDLSTSYVGAPVEKYNSANVLSSINIPGTNQVRFTLDDGITLMYDYYYNQWGTFTNIPAVSSTLYQNLHTFLNNLGEVFQENVGSFIDGSRPVLMSFTTAWLNLAGLQGFERIYYFYLLANYISPHKLVVGMAYDYNPSISQQVMISPTNYSGPWGSDTLWGSSSPWGGSSNVEQWRVFLNRMKCQAMQITVSEVYDASLGVQAGAGFTMSGINIVLGAKKGYTTIRAANSAG